MAFTSSVTNLLMVTMIVATIVLEGSAVAAATNHVVGGNFGWKIPTSTPSVYTDWSSANTFALGDTLTFNFETGQHVVVLVTKSGYDSCSTSDKIGNVLTNGPATVTLNVTGTNYFICGVPGHCDAGQKLEIKVGSTAPASAPAPMSGGSNFPTPGSPGEYTPYTTPGTGGDNNAATASLPGFSLAVVVLLVASFLMFC